MKSFALVLILAVLCCYFGGIECRQRVGRLPQRHPENNENDKNDEGMAENKKIDESRGEQRGSEEGWGGRGRPGNNNGQDDESRRNDDSDEDDTDENNKNEKPAGGSQREFPDQGRGRRPENRGQDNEEEKSRGGSGEEKEENDEKADREGGMKGGKKSPKKQPKRPFVCSVSIDGDKKFEKNCPGKKQCQGSTYSATWGKSEKDVSITITMCGQEDAEQVAKILPQLACAKKGDESWESTDVDCSKMGDSYECASGILKEESGQELKFCVDADYQDEDGDDIDDDDDDDDRKMIAKLMHLISGKLNKVVGNKKGKVKKQSASKKRGPPLVCNLKVGSRTLIDSKKCPPKDGECSGVTFNANWIPEGGSKQSLEFTVCGEVEKKAYMKSAVMKRACAFKYGDKKWKEIRDCKEKYGDSFSCGNDVLEVDDKSMQLKFCVKDNEEFSWQRFFGEGKKVENKSDEDDGEKEKKKAERKMKEVMKNRLNKKKGQNGGNKKARKGGKRKNKKQNEQE